MRLTGIALIACAIAGAITAIAISGCDEEAQPAGEGGACGAGSECASGLHCYDGACRAKQAAGSACDADDQCAGAQSCIVNKCSNKGVGSACEADSQCAGALSCVANVCGDVPAGGACTSSSQCAGNTSCVDNVCGGKITSGTCVTDSQCAGGLRCSNNRCQVIPAVDTTPPAPVTSLAALLLPDNTTVRLTWGDPTDADFSHVLISWAPPGGTPTQPLRVNKGDQSTDIGGLAAGTYDFTAVSVDTADNESASSAAASITVSQVSLAYICNNGTPAPGVPLGVDIERCDACDAGYHLEATTCVRNDYICSNGEEATGFPLEHNTERCTACDSGYRLIGDLCQVIPPPDTTPPALVTSFAAFLLPDNTTVRLTWTDPVDVDFSHVLIGWVPTGGATDNPLRVNSGVEEVMINDLPPGTYDFTAVSVDDADNESAPSAAVQIIVR